MKAHLTPVCTNTATFVDYLIWSKSIYHLSRPNCLFVDYMIINILFVSS
jgi:hypothetical protein